MAKNTYKIVGISFLAVILPFLAVSCDKNHGDDPVPPDPTQVTKITTVWDIADNVSEKNSHAGDEKYSTLQPVWRMTSTLKHGFLIPFDIPQEQREAWYPRIKRLSDGSLILFYQGGEMSSRIFCVKGKDFLTWSKPVMLKQPESVSIDGKQTYKRYMNIDALVMPDGEILAAYQFHPDLNDDGPYTRNKGCGLELIRSKDNGQTWGKAQPIYSKPSWEPYLLRLDDGTLHCYFTDATPATKNSGTSLMVSSDGGQTWTSKTRVCRQYKYAYDGPNTEYAGEKIYTDQMPVFKVLNDGKTIAGFLEARLENPKSIYGTSYHRMSLVYNDGLVWKNIGEINEGPERRFTNVIAGMAGGIETFPSGECVVCCSSDKGIFMMHMLDSSCNPPQSWSRGWMTPFESTGIWGSVERYSDNMLMAVCSNQNAGVRVGLFYLNHSLRAREMQVKVDGDNDEWTDKRAFFVGGKDGGEVIVRVARDKSNLYLLAESCGDDQAPLVTMTLSYGSSSPISVSVDRQGKVSSNSQAVAYYAKQGKSGDGRTGVLAEVSVPLSIIGTSEPGKCLDFTLTCNGVGFSDNLSSKPQSQHIVL